MRSGLGAEHFMAGNCGALRMEGERKMAFDENSPTWAARRLLRAARFATMATSAQGQPFASMVTPACMPDFSIVLFLSDLSEHTRHLRSDPRCSLLVSGPPAEANPQTAPRVTVTGLAESVDDPALKARYLAVHPYASLYAAFADFHLWRIKPLNALFVGGAAVAAAEASIIAHCNQDHATALAAIAREPGDWRMVTADVDGCDLAQEERVVRIPWASPAASAGDIRSELVRLAREARG
jgi:putative heme iron utilization protein